jgi:hypothetical protein
MEQPPYLSDMAPASFFAKLKLPLRGTRFQSVEDIKENTRQELTSISETAFKKCFDDWGLFVGVSISFLKEHTLKVKK